MQYAGALRTMKENLEDLKRRLFFVDVSLQQDGEDAGAVPFLVALARRLADGEISDAQAVEQLAELVVDGTVDARLLGSAGDIPAVAKAVTDKLTATLSQESSLPKVDGGRGRSIVSED